MKLIVTNAEKNIFWEEQTLAKLPVKDCMHVVNLFPELKGQTLKGFGGAVTEASAYNYSRLSLQRKREVIEACFGEEGLRYNMARVSIGSCDFGLGNYAYTQDGDQDMSTFSIDHDRQYVLPMIEDAQKAKGEPLSILASPWSPPAYMKTNGEMNNGGKLKEEYRSAWAKYYAAFIKAYRKAGADIAYLTVQNEPMAVQTWDSCIYTAGEEGAFVRDYLAPELARAGLSDVKIFIWDHNKEEAYTRVKETLADQAVSECVSGIAVHWYTGDHFEALEALKRLYPDKEIFFTEGCVEYSRFADSGEIQKAQMYAHDMLGNLKAGAAAILDWNLLLDEKGGPNHVGNFCAAPLMCEPEKELLEKRLSYYYIGHFSRYIQRGAKQIAVSRYTDKLECCAFCNPDGSRVTVLLNRTGETVPVTLRENGMGWEGELAPYSIVTVIFSE